MEDQIQDKETKKHSRLFSKSNLREDTTLEDSGSTAISETLPTTKKLKPDLLFDETYSNIPEDVKYLILNDSQGDLLNPSSSYDPLESEDSPSSPTLTQEDALFAPKLSENEWSAPFTNDLQELPSFVTPRSEVFTTNDTLPPAHFKNSLQSSKNNSKHSPKLPSLTGFSTASGASINPSRNSLEKAKKFFDDISSDSTFEHLNFVQHSPDRNNRPSKDASAFLQAQTSYSDSSVSTITTQPLDNSSFNLSSETSYSDSPTFISIKKGFKPPFKIQSNTSALSSKKSSSKRALSPYSSPSELLVTSSTSFSPPIQVEKSNGKQKSLPFRVPFKASSIQSNTIPPPSPSPPTSNLHLNSENSSRSSPSYNSATNSKHLLSRINPLFDLNTFPINRLTLKELGPPTPDPSIPYYSPSLCSSFKFPNGFNAHQAHQALLDAGAHADFEWTQNHYQWILFKLTNQYRCYHHHVPPYTPDTVLQQLKYRYTRESYNQFSILKRIIEGEQSFGAIPFILFISDIHFPFITLCDGWYTIKASLDLCLTRVLKSGKAPIGTKLICLPEVQHQPTLLLKLTGNKTKRVPYYSKLGLSKIPLLLNLCALAPDGGNCSQLQLQILRLYPMKKMVTLEDGSKQHIDFKQSLSNFKTDQPVVSYIKMKVGCLSTSCIAQLTLWNPEQDAILNIAEGHCFILLNITTTGFFKNQLQISTSRHTRWLPTKRKPKNKLYEPRNYITDFNVLFKFNQFPYELDLKGTVVQKTTEEKLTNFFLIDSSQSLFCKLTVFHASNQSNLKLLSGLEPGVFFVGKNLKLIRIDNQLHIPILYSSELSDIFTSGLNEKLNLDICLHQIDVLLNPLQQVDWDLFFAGGHSP